MQHPSFALRFVRACFIGACVAPGPARAQETTRVSVDSAGAEANYDCGTGESVAISADGRIVAFSSRASNLVAGDNNATLDVFVHDRSTGVTERVSVDSTGAEGNDESRGPGLSADGRFVVFSSRASNLVAGDVNGCYDTFIHDRLTGMTELVSVDSTGVQGDLDSAGVAISPDGNMVLLSSYATNLVAGDTNGCSDIFVRDLSTGITERVSIDSTGGQGNGQCFSASMSADGRIVAFSSDASNLVANDTNGCTDVFVHDRSTGITEIVSVRSNGNHSNGNSEWPTVSADGQIVAFLSNASNLVPHDTNGWDDVFVHDRTNGLTDRISVNGSGVQGNLACGTPSISANGKLIAYESAASNLVPGDSNNCPDAFLFDRSTGKTQRVSVDSSGLEEDAGAVAATIASDSTSANATIAFGSYATNLVTNDTNGFCDVFVHDLCSLTAAWFNYGAGFPGTNGVPAFASQQNPVLGATITLDLFNSYAQPTAGLVFVGFQRTSIHSNWGGDLLVVPALTLLVTFSFGGDSFTGTIPDDHSLCGFTIDLQAIEADPGAAKGISFTPGLELTLGR